MQIHELVVAYGTLIITAFAIVIAFLLGKSTFKYQEEVHRIRVESQEKIDSITAFARSNRALVEKTDLVINLMRENEGLRSSREILINYFVANGVDLTSDVGARQQIEGLDADLARREIEMRLLDKGPSKSYTEINSLVETLGDEKSILFLTRLKEVYQDDVSHLDNAIGAMNSRIFGTPLPQAHFTIAI